MFLAVRKYNKVQGNKQVLSEKINSEFVPLISKINGFVDYYCLYPDENSLLSVSVYQDKNGAIESVKAAADYVAKNLTQFLPEKPEIIAGDVFTGRQEMKKAA